MITSCELVQKAKGLACVVLPGSVLASFLDLSFIEIVVINSFLGFCQSCYGFNVAKTLSLQHKVSRLA